MATGDLKNNIRRLQSKLKLCNYPKDLDIKGISKGLAQEFLPILHYILLDFSRPLAEHIVNNDMELYGKSDDKFMTAVYKVFRDIFHYKPSITRQQFFSRGYAEHKIILVVDLVRMVKDKHKELCKALQGTSHKNVAGSLSRLRCTPSKERVASAKTASDPDQSTTPDQPTTPDQSTIPDHPTTPDHQPTTPDLLAASSSEEATTVFLPTDGAEPKATETDIGYHTAETSPTFKSRDKQENTKKATVSVNELRAKFETSGLHKQESCESKLSDTDLEEHPVIQALVRQIVHLEEQLTETKEEMKICKEKAEERHSTMQAGLVLMQNTIILLESKVSTESAEGKPVRPALAKGIPQDLPLAFLRPNQRRPENVPLPESPVLPHTPNQSPSSAQTPPPPLSISAVDTDQESAPKADLVPNWYPLPSDHDDPVQDPSARYHPQPTTVASGGVMVPISVVGPLQSLLAPGAEVTDPDTVTIRGATSPSPMDTAWIRPCSSTPIEASVDDSARHRIDTEAAADAGLRGPEANDDDIDEGLVDVDDGDLGEYIVETARDYSGEVPSARGQDEEAELEEGEVDVVPVRDVEQVECTTDEAGSVYSQMQRVHDMLACTQQMLAMNTSPTPDPSKED